MKIIPKLSELALENHNQTNGMISETVVVSNIDDHFAELSKRGIKEVEIARHEMIMIVYWMVANANGVGRKGCESDAWKALMEGKVNKFFGVKLRLEDV